MHSSKLDVLLLFQCYASSMLFIHASTFAFCKNRRWAFFFICSYKNVFYKVNTSLACLMNIGGDRQELAHVCTKLCSLLHSYVLMFFCLIYCCFQLGVWLDSWSLQGMTESLVLIAFCGCLLVLDWRTQEQKFHWMFECLFKRAWHTFVLSMFAPFVLGFQLFCCIRT